MNVLSVASLPASVGAGKFSLAAATLQVPIMLASIILELTLREIITDIPHDAGAFLTLVLVGLFAFFIWHGSRGRSGGSGGAR